jgi:hypothetical protein
VGDLVLALASGEAVEEFAAGLPEGFDGALGGRLQQSFELVEGLLDGVDVGL